nr:hypothetical protein [Candidatus Sigynarchaeota archaeon]
MGRIYLTVLGRSIWAVINAFYAVVKNENIKPDIIFIVTETIYENKLAKTIEGISVILEHFGLRARIETSVVQEGSYIASGKQISTLLKDVASKGHAIDVDITPGRKALVSGLLMAISGSKIKVDHLFYLDIATIVNVNFPYDMIPRSMQTLRDFMHEFNTEFKETSKHAGEE